MTRMAFLQGLLGSVFARQETQAFDIQNGPLPDLCDALLSERGENSGIRLARSILTRVEANDNDARKEFFDLLANRYDLDADEAVAAATAYRDTRDEASYSALIRATEPQRQELLRRLNRFSGATGKLVDLRASLRADYRQHEDFPRVDSDIRHLFASWFNRGFLVLREIDWHTPANILEKIIAYEAVHAIDSWEDLRQRVEPADRKCFAFFHPAMLDEPLIFVEVALTDSTPDSIAGILTNDRDVLDTNQANTAVFYSISNCQPGLAGVSFGNSLIKLVARELAAALPNLKVFRTLSPVPSVVNWARRVQRSGQTPESISDSDIDTVLTVAAGERLPDTDEAREACTRLVARYLVNERRDDQQPHDPVARFHLGNGASLADVLPLADPHEKGIRQSAGVMVSYLYDLDDVDANHEAYAKRREVITSNAVDRLLVDPKRRKSASAKRDDAQPTV